MPTLTRWQPLQAVVKSEGGGRRVRVIISTAERDRAGDIVEPAGVDLTNFKRTGSPVLWNHNAAFPVARATEVRVMGDGLEAVAQFPSEGTDETSDRVFKLIGNGLVSSASIGFLPLDWEPLDPGWGRRYKKCELVEFSFVAVPANAGAVVVERSLPAALDRAAFERAVAQGVERVLTEARRPFWHRRGVTTEVSVRDFYRGR